jgi:transmembrane sensor
MFVQSGLPDREFAWTNGVLVADGMRLGEFLAELARYRPGLLSCAPELENLPITGTFRIQNTDLVLEALAASQNLKLDYRTRYWVKVLPA